MYCAAWLASWIWMRIDHHCIGAIHKVRQHFFRYFWHTPPPMSVLFNTSFIILFSIFDTSNKKGLTFFMDDHHYKQASCIQLYSVVSNTESCVWRYSGIKQRSLASYGLFIKAVFESSIEFLCQIPRNLYNPYFWSFLIFWFLKHFNFSNNAFIPKSKLKLLRPLIGK